MERRKLERVPETPPEPTPLRKHTLKRMLRVIEYVGDDQFLQDCIEHRAVKGTMTPKWNSNSGRPNCYIREAMLGDLAEILPEPPKDR